MQDSRVQDVCPLLLPSTPLGRCYHGYISVAGEDFALRLTLPPGRELKDARLECDWRLRHMLRGMEGMMQKHLEQSHNEASFLLRLKSTLDHMHTTHSPTLSPPIPPSHYSQLLSDIDQLGWDTVLHISPDFSCLKVKASDQSRREHILSINISQHLQLPPTVHCDLPLPFQFSWSQQSTLVDIVRQFKEELSRYQLFWDELDQLDSRAWVLEPENPSPSCNHRRIVIGQNTSIHLIVNPLKPLALPECKFLGPEHMVTPLRERWVSRLAQWNPQVTLSQNLEYLLGLTLPQPEANQQEGFSGECGICYAYRLEGLAPEVVCNYQHCSQPFHYACLFEWLKSLSTTRQSFGTLFGECPYCSEQISIKVEGH